MDPMVRFLPNTRPIGFLLPAAATAIAPAIPAAARPTKLRRVTPFGCGLVRSCNYFTLLCVVVVWNSPQHSCLDALKVPWHKEETEDILNDQSTQGIIGSRRCHPQGFVLYRPNSSRQLIPCVSERDSGMLVA